MAGADDYAELVKRLDRVAEFGGTHLDGMWSEAARAIEALVRENEELDFLKWEGGEESVGREIEKAFQRGREAGIREAAKEASLYGLQETTIGDVFNSQSLDIAAKILALIDKPQENANG